jgi:hypothetical protein
VVDPQFAVLVVCVSVEAPTIKETPICGGSTEAVAVETEILLGRNHSISSLAADGAKMAMTAERRPATIVALKELLDVSPGPFQVSINTVTLMSTGAA